MRKLKYNNIMLHGIIDHAIPEVFDEFLFGNPHLIQIFLYLLKNLNQVRITKIKKFVCTHAPTTIIMVQCIGLTKYVYIHACSEIWDMDMFIDSGVLHNLRVELGLG